MTAAFDAADWDVHLVRQVLTRAGQALSAKTIQARTDLCWESTYAALLRMHACDAVRIISVGRRRSVRAWELLRAAD